MSEVMVTRVDIEAYARDGAIVLRGVFANWVDTIAAGIARNMAEPGPYAAENTTDADTGRFFDDYCNWERIPEFVEVVCRSDAARIAAEVMQSRESQFFHDHVLVKEPGTSKTTPWHQDIPYYFVDGHQTVSLWIPVDPAGLDASPQFIRGSHLWEKPVLPVRWLDDSSFYSGKDDYLPVPDPAAEPDRYAIVSWDMAPGDAVLFDFRTVHGAPPNTGTERRRALSLRFVGDDARYVERPGRTSPPYPGHDMKPGQRLRQDWFPVLWPPRDAAAA